MDQTQPEHDFFVSQRAESKKLRDDLLSVLSGNALEPGERNQDQWRAKAYLRALNLGPVLGYFDTQVEIATSAKTTAEALAEKIDEVRVSLDLLVSAQRRALEGHKTSVLSCYAAVDVMAFRVESGTAEETESIRKLLDKSAQD